MARTLRLELPRLPSSAQQRKSAIFPHLYAIVLASFTDYNFIRRRKFKPFFSNLPKCFLFPLTPQAAYILASRSRYTLESLTDLKRVRDFAQIHHAAVITPSTVTQALEMLDVDDQGLDFMDRHIPKRS